jgi:hypothetical protein
MLRLGRVVRGVQKGVDSRIVRDLIVLAHDRAMDTAYCSPAMKTFVKALWKHRMLV